MSRSPVTVARNLSAARSDVPRGTSCIRGTTCETHGWYESWRGDGPPGPCWLCEIDHRQARNAPQA